MDASTTAEPAAAASLPVAVFGLDDLGKAHASRFTAAEAELATKAAGLMGMHVLALASPDCGDLAERLPAGRIFEKSGKAFVPFVARPMFDRLATLGGIPLPPPGAKAERAPKPHKAAGAAKAGAEASGDTKPARAVAVKPAPQVPAAATSVALSWNDIAAGSLVLATTGGPAEGWFEAVVQEAKPDQLFVLRWRDFDEPLFLRRVNQLALLPVGTPLAVDH